MNFKLKGEYVIMKGSSPDNMVEVAKFDNLITDVGLQAISTQNLVAYCYLGTGNAVPQVTDVGMNSYLAQQGQPTTLNIPSQHFPGPPMYNRAGAMYRFLPGNGTGNIAEVGVGYSSHSSTNRILFSRALIRDMEGNPTVITKLDTDYLDVYYYLSVYLDDSDSTQIFDYKGVSTTWTGRLSRVNIYNTINLVLGVWPAGNSAYSSSQQLGTIYDLPPINPAINATMSLLEKVPGTTYRDVVSTIPLSNTTVQTIGNERLNTGYNGGGGYYQSSFDPPLVKEIGEILYFRYRISWGRL